ncbi:MAG: polysaccharide deacetylase family protein [Acidimicrobiales bacterium]
MALSRRRFLLAAGSAAALAACARTGRHTASPPSASAGGPAAAGPVPTSTPPATVPVARGPARFVHSGPTTGGQMALTFHGSGDVGVVTALLDVARRVRAPITVFAVGQWLEANPAMADRLRADGHELANHTYTHPALASVDRAGVASEITRCRDVLARLSGSGGRWFRPSGVDVPTSLMLEEAGSAGYGTVVGYDIDPLDYTDPGAAAVLSRTRAKLHAGAIVSLHTGHQGTVDAFEPVVAAVRAAGLEPVVVSELLK